MSTRNRFKFNLNLVKQISWRLLFVVIGVIIAFIYFHFKITEKRFFYGPKLSQEWRKLGGDTGRILMRDYLDEQNGVWPHYLRLRTGDKEEILRGFWIDRKMLEEIQREVSATPGNPAISGYSVFFGKWDEWAKRYYSLVVRATTGVPNKDGRGVGPFYDMVDPCPDNCSGELP